MNRADEDPDGGKPKQALYETVAQSIVHLVDHGTYGVGDRIPSIRGLSRRMQVSLTTVMEAYRLLEDWGVIEAHPQPGFYVRARPQRGGGRPDPGADGRPRDAGDSERA